MPDFADAWILWAMPLPLLIRWILPPRQETGAALLVPDELGARMTNARVGADRPGLSGWHMAALIWCLLIVAIAGPRQLSPVAALPTSGRDMIVALDLSGSMVREDFALDGVTMTRLQVVQRVGADFVSRRDGDRIGLVVFGSEAYVAAPLSFDVASVAQTIATSEIGISGRATNMSDAMGLSLRRLRGSDAETRVVILLSDGANNAGAAAPRDVARLASDMGVRVHTIAMGPKDRESAPKERGTVDTRTLADIATMTGGQMFRVKTTADRVDVMAAIDALEPTARAGLAADTFRDLWVYPAILAGLLCLFLAYRRAA